MIFMCRAMVKHIFDDIHINCFMIFPRYWDLIFFHGQTDGPIRVLIEAPTQSLKQVCNLVLHKIMVIMIQKGLKVGWNVSGRTIMVKFCNVVNWHFFCATTLFHFSQSTEYVRTLNIKMISLFLYFVLTYIEGNRSFYSIPSQKYRT